ncbi:hypothetical protein GF325_05570 [Candidatus Bathyarchaeota archaeon]|nr:hypothetical protein [Candidatus Bathyarchaeota archaeon]
MKIQRIPSIHHLVSMIILGGMVTFSLCTNPLMNAGSGAFASSIAPSIINRDRSFSWNASTVPSIISYQVKDFSKNLTDESEYSVPTTMPITSTKMLFDNITADNISLIIEPYAAYAAQSNDSYNVFIFQQLKIPGNCYIPWVNIFIQYLNIISPPVNWTVSLFNSTPDLFSQEPIPDQQVPGTNVSINPMQEEDPEPLRRYLSHWENVTMPRVLLNTSETFFYEGYYHFFLAVLMPMNNGPHHYWFYSPDNEGIAEDYGKVYASISAQSSEIGSGNENLVRLVTVEIPDVDFCVITKLEPISSHPKPSDIGLKVDGKFVSDVDNGTGRLLSMDEKYPSGNQVEYDITSRWSEIAPGSVTFDLEGNFMIGQEITPDVTCDIASGSSNVTWTMDYEVDYLQQDGNETAALQVHIPFSWNIIDFTNETGGGIAWNDTTVAFPPPFKYQSFIAANITPGDWKLSCTSEFTPGEIQLETGVIDYNQLLTGNVTITGGPNGENETLRSDYEGGVSSFTINSGFPNGTSNASIRRQDAKAIEFTELSVKNYTKLLEKIITGDILGEGTTSVEFDLHVDTGLGFKEENLERLEVHLDHSGMDRSYWFGYIDNASMPENPDNWNVEGIPIKDAQEKILEYDYNGIITNFTYNLSENRYADFYFNLSCRILFNETYITREEIMDFTLAVVTNFSKIDNEQSIHVKNQSSGNFFELDAVVNRTGFQNDSYLYWENGWEVGLTNLSEIINPDNNTVEFFLRTINKTDVTYDPSGYSIRVDTGLLGFNYTNGIDNLTVQAYNWSSGMYEPVSATINGTPGDMFTIINLATMSGNLQGMFDEVNSTVRIMVNASGIIPVLNVFWWTLDMIMLNVTYENYDQFTWRETVLDDAGTTRYSNTSTTLFDSPANNYSIAISPDDILTYTDQYLYEMIWSNGTDLMATTSDFNISRIESTLEIIAGDEKAKQLVGNSHVLSGKLSYTSNLSAMVNKTIMFTIEVELSNGSLREISYSAITDGQGIASITIPLNTTWDAFMFSLSYSDDEPKFKSSEISSTVMIMILTKGEYVLDFISDNVMYIMIAAIAIITISFYRHNAKVRKRRRWEHDADKIRDIVKIQHLLVIVKDSGACVVNRSYSKVQLDADLISGFLTAIATFSKEVGPRKPGMDREKKTILFDYENFKILIQDGLHVRIALILDGVPTDNVREKLQSFTEAFESRYNLQKWRGNLQEFANVDVLIENAFEITMVYPLVVNPDIQKSDIKSGLGKALFEVAEAVQEEKQAFYMSSLLNYAQAGRKESQNHVLSEIYHLKKQGAFRIYHPPAKTTT